MSNGKNKALATELGLNYKDDLVYGIYKEYPVSVYDLKGCKILFIDAKISTNQQIQKDDIRSYIVECSKQYSIRSSSINESGIKIAFNNKVGVYDNIADFFLAFVLFLEANDIKGKSVCANCRKYIKGEPKLIHISGEVHSCDEACASKLVDLGSGNRKAAQTRSTVFGVIGALIGATLGGIGHVAFSVTGFYSLWFGLIIALFSKVGYYVFGGESVKADRISTLIASFLSVCASQLIIEGISVSATWQSKGYIFKVIEPFIAIA